MSKASPDGTVGGLFIGRLDMLEGLHTPEDYAAAIQRMTPQFPKECLQSATEQVGHLVHLSWCKCFVTVTMNVGTLPFCTSNMLNLWHGD